MSKLNKLLTLRIILVTIWLCTLLFLTKLPRLLRTIESKSAGGRIDDAALQLTIEKINRVARYKYFLIRNNCLRKNLVIYYYLLRSGTKRVRIHIGISKKDANLDGHCWLTLNDILFGDSEEFVSKYAVIYSSGV